MMEEQECLEWSYREKEIEAIQDERMELLKKLLAQREVDYQTLNDKRLEYLWLVEITCTCTCTCTNNWKCMYKYFRTLNTILYHCKFSLFQLCMCMYTYQYSGHNFYATCTIIIHVFVDKLSNTPV